MTRTKLTAEIFSKKTYLCIGLDTDKTKIPKHLLSHVDPVFEFNRRIIDATKDYCVSYKINTAFYEALGVKGWETMEKTGEKNLLEILNYSLASQFYLYPGLIIWRSKQFS